MTDQTHALTRRTLLRAGAGAVAAGTLAGSVPAQAAAADPFGGWLSNTSNFDGSVVDETGSDAVTISVGVEGNNGPNGFGPAAVRVDPGTTVTWEWTGDGYHNVKASDGSFESEMTEESGHTFEQTFDSKGVQKYACLPHKTMGMKGVVVVGDVEVGGGGGSGEQSASGPDYGGWFENVSNFESTVDKTGQDTVTVKVGTSGNNGSFAFDPPAVTVDPGTTVRWEWTGKGGVHNVVAEDGSFGSETLGEAGATFESTFEDGGIHKYVCVPHENMGMKGAVVVTGSGGGNRLGRWLTIGGAVGLVGGLFGLIGAEQRGRQEK